MASHKPPFTLQTAHEKVKAAQALWNTKYVFPTTLSPPLPTQQSHHPQLPKRLSFDPSAPSIAPKTTPQKKTKIDASHQRPLQSRPRLHPHIHLAQPQHLHKRTLRNPLLPDSKMGKREGVQTAKRALLHHREQDRGAISGTSLLLLPSTLTHLFLDTSPQLSE